MIKSAIQAITGVLSSKKFWMTVVGSAATAALSYIGAPSEVLVIVGGLFGTGVAAQGVADIGKSAAIINASTQPK